MIIHQIYNVFQITAHCLLKYVTTYNEIYTVINTCVFVLSAMAMPMTVIIATLIGVYTQRPGKFIFICATNRLHPILDTVLTVFILHLHET